MEEDWVKNLAEGWVGGGEVDLFCPNVCECKKLLEDSHKILCKEIDFSLGYFVMIMMIIIMFSNNLLEDSHKIFCDDNTIKTSYYGQIIDIGLIYHIYQF